ncbi:MAG: helix-turn-helix transcriptional regulator [Actinomycetota bacterium]|nr:helix-turn-helix transcriptional regulator [Actinomycetota bacterium]
MKNLFLKELIMRRGYRQYEVARMAGIHPTLLSDYIIGARDISDERKQKLAEILGVDKEDIIKGEII